MDIKIRNDVYQAYKTDRAMRDCVIGLRANIDPNTVLNQLLNPNGRFHWTLLEATDIIKKAQSLL